MSSAFCAVTGRAVADAERREAQSGTSYAVARVAVDVEQQRDGEAGRPEPWWLRVMAFGRSADSLASVRNGEVLHAAGRLERSHYAGRDGAEREGWTLLADSVIAARPPSSRGRSKAKPPPPPPDDHERETLEGETP